MSWTFHPAGEKFADYVADWDRLNAELYGGHPYYDSRFVGTLLKFFSKGEERLCLFRDLDGIRAALILVPRGLGRWETFRPAQAQITPILVGDDTLLVSLFTALPGLAWSIDFHAVDPRYAPAFSPSRLKSIVSHHAQTIGVGSGIEFAKYWQERPKNLRSNIRMYANRISLKGCACSFSSLFDLDSMTTGIRRYGDLEGSWWKAQAGTAVAIDNIQGSFYSELLARFAESGQAEICELSIGEQLAASRLMIDNERMLVILKTSYNESLAHFSPGRMHLHHLLERQLTEHPERTVEFYTNATQDQLEWATFRCNIHNIQLFRNDGAVVGYSMLKALKRRLANNLGGRQGVDGTLSAFETLSFTSIKDLIEGRYFLGEFAPSENFEKSLEWFDLLQKQVYPDDPGVRYYVATDRGHQRAVLPLRLAHHRGVRTLESLSNYYTSLYSPLMSNECDPQVLALLLSAATKECSRAHVIRFAPMDPDSHVYSALMSGLRAAGWIPLTFFCFGNWYLQVTGGWEEYLRLRGANLRSSIKRRNRDFAAEGGTLEVVSGPDRLEEALAAFLEVYSASWKKPEPYPDFVPSLVRLLATRGMLRLGIARLQGRPIAAQLWIAGEGKASIYKVAYHHAYASLSPGTVLTSYLLRHVIEKDQVLEVDFLIGDDDYKKVWMSNRRERWGIIAFNPRTVIGCVLLVKEVLGRMAKGSGSKFGATLSRARAAISAAICYPGTIVNNQLNSRNAQQEQPMNWIILPINKFSEHAAQWDALVRSRLGTPFLESAFLLPLLAVFANGSEHVCLLQENGRLCAAVIVQRGRTAIWQTFQPSQLPLGALVTDGQLDLAAVTSSLLRQLPGVTMALGISQVDPNLQQRPADSSILRTQDYISTAWVDLDSNFDDYWEARGKNLKQNTRKQRNKLQVEGIATRIECITVPEAVAEAIKDYGTLESAGWKGADGTAIAPDNEQGRFYKAMLENYCAQGRGRIYRYWFGDKVVAMDLCIHDDAVLVILKTAYDESYKSVSPSSLMRQDQFQQLFAEQKFRRIEFFGKVMEWHTRWTSQSRTIYHATAYRWAWLKALHARRAAANEAPAPVAPAEI